ncbi:MAG: sn-glycerol-3-phosphate ABC transporter ATP-binding protein UgpC [Erysipelotrichaceae bacterium]|nr:sn-glycerol-3-phosphate ABC transporter ATP-binding protein UgpC [Erysipelotrichaceae bacterium]MBP5279361.1 sn-glycerol-3-phosphate ABC transporter ATP-binding protein UgpC [Erysipelotrichaceae bacterium]
MSNLVLKDINKIYPNGFHAVHNFNLEINDGEFIVFVGPSGCGKSTTLRMIAGLEEISKGDFLINGERANEKSPVDRGIAMVFQSYALYPHLSVYDNLAFGLTLEGVDEDVIDEKVQNIAGILGLTDYLDRKPRALSGGQRQRVAVGRAIIRQVDIFLMDEPLSNLDAKQRVTMRSEISQIHRATHATTIYVTHDQTEAMTMADRIVVMKDGYVQQIGTPEELYFDPCNLFVGGFIGEPPMNFITGTIKGNEISFDKNNNKIDGSKTRYQLKDGDIYFGFRPENISMKPLDEAYKIHATATLTEMLGDSTNIYIEVDDDTLILKVDPHDAPEMDEEFDFYIPYDKVYLFDKETEKVFVRK